MVGCHQVAENLQFTPLRPGGLSGRSTVGFAGYPGECSFAAVPGASASCGTADQIPQSFIVQFSFLLNGGVYSAVINLDNRYTGPGTYHDIGFQFAADGSNLLGGGNGPVYLDRSETVTVNSDEASGTVSASFYYYAGYPPVGSNGDDTHVTGEWRC